MPFSTYDELKTSLQNWCSNRSDVPTNSEDFIRLAEGSLSLIMRNRKQVTVQTLTPVSGEVIIPEDFAGVRSVVMTGTPRRNLDFITIAQADRKYDVNVGGIANAYTIIGEVIKTYPMATQDIELTYYAEIPQLSNDTPGTSDTNWLLKKFPNLYLEASQAEFFRWNQDMENLQISMLRVQDMTDRINDRDDLDVYGDATATIQGYTP